MLWTVSALRLRCRYANAAVYCLSWRGLEMTNEPPHGRISVLSSTAPATTLPRLYSLDDIIEMFPPAERPGRRLMAERARATGCFRKIGRKIVFTKEDVKELLEALRQRPRHSAPRYGGKPPKPGSSYEKVRAMIEERASARKRKHLQERAGRRNVRRVEVRNDRG